MSVFEIRLLKNYRLRTKDNDPETLLLSVIDLAPSEGSNSPYISIAQSLPADVNCNLEVSIDHFDSDEAIQIFLSQKMSRRSAICGLL